MAKKVILKDHDNNEIMPITRGELILDSSGNEAFHSDEFLATDTKSGLLSKEDKSNLIKLSTGIAYGNADTVDGKHASDFLPITGGTMQGSINLIHDTSYIKNSTTGYNILGINNTTTNNTGVVGNRVFVGDATLPLTLRGKEDLIHSINGNTYPILDTNNYQIYVLRKRDASIIIRQKGWLRIFTTNYPEIVGRIYINQTYTNNANNPAIIDFTFGYLNNIKPLIKFSTSSSKHVWKKIRIIQGSYVTDYTDGYIDLYYDGNVNETSNNIYTFTVELDSRSRFDKWSIPLTFLPDTYTPPTDSLHHTYEYDISKGIWTNENITSPLFIGALDGSATSLTTNAGSINQPVYFNGGVPVAANKLETNIKYYVDFNSEDTWSKFGGTSSNLIQLNISSPLSNKSWLSQPYSPYLVFGLDYNKGMLGISHLRSNAIVTFGGTNNGDYQEPWYWKLKGTDTATYTLPTKTSTLASIDDIPTNYVTLDTTQVITGKKIFKDLSVYGDWENDFGIRFLEGNMSTYGFGFLYGQNDTFRLTTSDGYVIDLEIFKAYRGSTKVTFTGNVTASKFITSNGTSSQFVKGDGTLDNNTYARTSDIPTKTSQLIKDDVYMKSEVYNTSQVNELINTLDGVVGGIIDTWRPIHVQNSSGSNILTLGDGSTSGDITLKAGTNLIASVVGNTVTFDTTYNLFDLYTQAQKGVEAYNWGNHAGKYLPLTGGTLTGLLRISNNKFISTSNGQYILGYSLDNNNDSNNSTTKAPYIMLGHINYNTIIRSKNNIYNLRSDKENYATVLDDYNYTDYTVQKDGTGATGTWNIDINGDAKTLNGIKTYTQYTSFSFTTKKIRIPISYNTNYLITLRGTNTGRGALIYVTGYGSGGTKDRITIRHIYSWNYYKFYINGNSEESCIYIEHTDYTGTDDGTVTILSGEIPTITVVDSIPNDATLATIDKNIIATKSDIPTKLSQFTDDVVSGKYLPLSGGTIKGSSDNPLTINTTATNGPYVYLQNNGSNKGLIGHYNNFTYIADVGTLARIGITTSGVPQFWTHYDGSEAYNLAHAGNTSYMATTTSSTTGAYAIGTLNIAGESFTLYGKDTNTDTLNTAGSTDTSSKIFLIGATSQAANPQTYSHDTAYVGTDGCLYSNSTKVSVEGHRHLKEFSVTGDGKAVKYFRALRIDIKSTYTNDPVEFTFTRRSDATPTRVSIGFTNTSSTDPALNYFKCMGTCTDIYIYKVQTSIWYVYIKQTEAYDRLSIYYTTINNFLTLTWESTIVETLPEGYTKVSLGYSIGNAATATSATTASKLSTVSKTAWGQTFWTSGGVPTNISGDMTEVGSISMSKALTLTGTSAETSHIKFSRNGWNYITIPEGDTNTKLAIGKGTGAINTYYWFDNASFTPQTTNVHTLGIPSHVWANVYATTFTGNLTGNADTATTASKLTTPRTIWGQSFDGSSNVDGDIIFSSTSKIGTEHSPYNKTIFNKIVIDGATDGIQYYSGGWTGSEHTVHTFLVGTDNKKSLVIKNSGFVGINTDTPTQQLQVNGNVKADTFLGNLDWSYIQNKPTSLPANGGNADTLGGYSRNSFIAYTKHDPYVSARFISEDLKKHASDTYIEFWGPEWYNCKWGTITAINGFIGNLDGTYVNKLTGYTKATSASNITATDSLNTALGKLEYKAGTTYDWYKSITQDDTDTIINKWGEIVDFIDSVAEGTDITDEFVTRKTEQTITGAKIFATNILTISNPNAGDATLKFYRGGNTAWSIVDTGGNLKFNELTSNTTRLVLYESSQGGSAAFAGQVTATKFITSSGTSSQFVKGDGSLDSTEYFKTSSLWRKSNSKIFTTKGWKRIFVGSYPEVSGRIYINQTHTSNNNRPVIIDFAFGYLDASKPVFNVYTYSNVWTQARIIHGSYTTGYRDCYIDLYYNGVINSDPSKGSGAYSITIEVDNRTNIRSWDITMEELSSSYTPPMDSYHYTYIYDLQQGNWFNHNVIADKLIKSGGTSSQFLKADGSVDSTSYATSASLGNYLPLTGGTLTGDNNILNLNGTTNSYIYYKIGSTKKASSGYYNNFAFIANEKTYARIGVADDGTPQYHTNNSMANVYTLLHSGNYNSYALPLTGGTLSGNLIISGNSPTIIRNVILNSTTGWARDICALQVDGVTKFSIGGYGSYTKGATDNDIKYVYLSCNSWNGLGLRISRTELKWGDAAILHANNYTSYAPILNSSSTHATSTSVIYAPTTAGTSGQYLMSNGSGAPVWTSLPALASPYAIKFKNTAGTEVSYNGSVAVDLTDGIEYAANTTRIKIDNSPIFTTGGLHFLQIQGNTDILPDTEWHSIIRAQHGGYTNGYWQDLALPFYENKRIRYRVNRNGTKHEWKSLAYTSDIKWSNLADKPTTINGYGITDTFTIKDDGNVYINLSMPSAALAEKAKTRIECWDGGWWNWVAGKWITAGGTSSHFVKGDGSLDSTTYATSTSLNDYLPLTGGQMKNAAVITFTANGTLRKTTATTSNADSIIQWYKGTTKDPNYTYSAQIGWHNTGDTDGAIYLIPHPTSTEPWAGTVGLYIGKNTIKWKNQPLIHSGNISSYALTSLPSHTHNYASIGNVVFTPANSELTSSEVLSLTGGWSIKKGTWDYAGNGYIKAGNFGNIDLAGTSIITIGNTGAYTQLYITAPTQSGHSGKTNEIFFYNNHGSSYSPGWTRVLTDRNYSSYALPLIGGTLSGLLTINNTAGDAFDQKYISLTNNSTEGARIGIDGNSSSGLGLYAKGIIYLRPNSSFSSSTYGLVISSTSLTYNGQNVLHAGNYSSYLGYIGTTAVQSSSVAQALTGITNATMSGTTTTKLLVISDTSGSKHIQFSRSGYNYFYAPTSGSIAFCVNGYEHAMANCDLVISGRMVHPGTSNQTNLGSTNYRWNNIYCVGGNFTSDVNSETKFKASNSNGAVSVYTSTNRGLYDETNGAWIIYLLKDASHVYVPKWANKGSSSVPVYFNSSGEPVACTTYLGYIGTTAVQANSASQSLTGIANITMSGTLTMNANTGIQMKYNLNSSTGDVWMYPNGASTYGIRYYEGTPDKMAISASGNNNSVTGADLCINGNGDGTVTIRGNTILHTGNIDSNNLTTISKSLKVTSDWMDTGIKHTDLPNDGTYIIQIYTHNSTDGLWYTYWSGIMSWYRQETNDNDSDEIILHRAGHAYGHTIYLRTIMTARSDGRNLRLQIAADTDLSTASTYTFKFKRVI